MVGSSICVLNTCSRPSTTASRSEEILPSADRTSATDRKVSGASLSKAMEDISGKKTCKYIPVKFDKDGLITKASMIDNIISDDDIEAIRKEREASGDKVLFFDIPLLFETGTHVDYDAVLVVTADYEIRKARIMERDGIDPAIIDLIMDTQSDEERKIAMADFVIFNNGTIEELHDAVDMLIKKLEF